MTEALFRFVQAHPNRMIDQDTYDAYFWLTAFVAEVEQRTDDAVWLKIFHDLIRDFGLEERR